MPMPPQYPRTRALGALATAMACCVLASTAGAEERRGPESVTITNSSIGVSNTAASPLFVDPGSTARNGMGSYCYANIDPATGNTTCTLAVIPAGKILVIESIMCFAHIPTGRPFNTIVLTYGAPDPQYPNAGNLATINHFLTMLPTPNGNYGDITAYSLTTPIKLYAFGPASTSGATTSVWINVQIGAFTLGTTLPQFGCSIAGNYENQ